MPVKKKPTAKQLAARKKFVQMVRAKAKAKKIASTHKDTKSHNVNVKVVSGMKKKSEKRQTGTSVKSKDKLYAALPPGKRISASGRTYYERRANRSDKGKLLGINTNRYTVSIDNTMDDSYTPYGGFNTLAAAKKVLMNAGIDKAIERYSDEIRRGIEVVAYVYDNQKNEMVLGYNIGLNSRKKIVKRKII